ncbi:MFS transporter small subunit [Pollutimonas sp. M17]|nr:oxalate:formate antiporter [Pollutimonas sp. M17]UYO93006.1 oxalate:formate antiporter [Pollutimonas sp. M17]HWK72562.1 oxalate:formate antiporter [Burkholderiaceae bacterium]
MENTTSTTAVRSTTSPILLIIFWLYVGIPLAIGVWETLLKAAALFK